MMPTAAFTLFYIDHIKVFRQNSGSLVKGSGVFTTSSSRLLVVSLRWRLDLDLGCDDGASRINLSSCTDGKKRHAQQGLTINVDVLGARKDRH